MSKPAVPPIAAGHVRVSERPGHRVYTPYLGEKNKASLSFRTPYPYPQTVRQGSMDHRIRQNRQCMKNP